MRNCCGQVELPGYSGSPVNTLIVTCTQLDELPTKTVDYFLGPFVAMRFPGAIPDITDSSNGKFLAGLLQDNQNIKHLVVCAHSLCEHFDCSVLSQDEDAGESEEDENDWKPKYKLGLLQQNWLSKMVRLLKIWTGNLGRADLEIHAWIYEPEVEWISAMDHETDMFVPLNACTKLVCQ